MLLSRRSTLAVVAVTLVTASACDVDDLRPPEDDAAPSPTPTAPGEPTLDEQLVDGVLAALETATWTVVAARQVPGLRKPLGALLRAHRAHVTALDGSQAFGTPLPPPAGGPAALASVREAERAVRDAALDAATRAESGALARLMASLTASVSQHLAVLA